MGIARQTAAILRRKPIDEGEFNPKKKGREKHLVRLIEGHSVTVKGH